jgi:hypothetical protein
MSLPHSVAHQAGGALFGALAGVFRRRPLHPTGIAFRGELTLPSDAPGAGLVRGTVLGEAGTRALTARFSRGFGLPEPLPEILSLGLKIHGAREQDLLLTAGGRKPVLRHLLTGGRDHLGAHYTTILPFEAGGRRILVGVVPRSAAAPGFDDLEHLARTSGIHLCLRVAQPLRAWRDVGEIVLRGAPLSDVQERALAFTTEQDAGGIRAVGVVNAARGGAYAAAQRVRPRR